jgi:hypothetical protein
MALKAHPDGRKFWECLKCGNVKSLKEVVHGN